ncbi:periaxin [Plakobranchus ocellatus]|uniref:Periaxin n=1 Tax=Plakobranchus ocellatus TaxID=259542 RepID=A0AAV4BD97_9GAST|nr:periaxin [Plakobranchus ocellatus]
MAVPYLLLPVGVLFALVTPAHAGCDPSPAVVAVASVLSTLAVVALLLIAIYFCRRRSRRKGDSMRRATNHYQPHGMINRAFSHPDEGGMAEHGFGSPKTFNHNKPKEFPKSSRDRKTWSSLPPSDRAVDGIASRLDRQGSCGSLDDGYSRHDPEVISVTLESHDIIGLGFNISGNMSSGIQVSEVHNRGPARDSGVVAVGDRILSVSVSYENIVYEDALTILSYASPYPVKLLLEKSPTQDNPSPILGPRPRRLSHPMFRSRSQDASDPPPSPLPKRSRSAVTKPVAATKTTGNRLFLKWKSAGGRSEHKSEKKPSSLEDTASLQKGGLRSWGSERDYVSQESDASSSPHHSLNMTTVAIVSESYKEGKELSLSSDKHDGIEKDSLELKDMSLASVTAETDVITQHSAVQVKAIPPGKPERKNRRKSDLQFEQTISSSSATSDQVSGPPPSQETEVQEEAIVATKSDRRGPALENTEKSSEDTKDLEGALDFIRNEDFSSLKQPLAQAPSPPGTPVEEELIFPTSKASGETNNNIKSFTDHDIDNEDRNYCDDQHQEMMQQQQQQQESQQSPPAPPGLDDESLDRIIAMNSFAPGTQGWAGLRAGGLQGGIRDDFVPDHPLFTSFPAQGGDSHSISSSSSNSFSTNSNSNINNRGLAYEIRDDIVTGRPVVVGLGGKGRVASSGRQDSAASDTTTTSSGTGKGQGQGEGSECSDTLDWSGQRLVRSPSFSNIFVAD